MTETGHAVVVDHHVSVGNVSRLVGPDVPRQYAVELMHRLESPLPRSRRITRLSALVEDRAGFKLRAAWDATRLGPVDCYVSLSEQVGFPLALLNRGRVPHVMVAHNLATRFKDRLQRRTGWLEWPDEIVVVSRSVADHVCEAHGLDPEHVHVLDLPVDVDFFVPDAGAVEDDLVLAVGREHRDYRCLVAAARRLPEYRFLIVSNSPFAKGSARGEDQPSPHNVEFVPWLAPRELRDLYQRAAVAVVSIEAGVRFGAGTTTIAEAQATGTPIVAADVPGLAGYLDPSSVRAFPAGDSPALAAAIGSLLGDSARRETMGVEGRRIALERRTIDGFCEAMASIVDERKVTA